MTTDNPTQLENKLEPCPKCLDCWALQVQEQEPPLLAKTVTCGRCGFRAPFDTWQARIPAQPPFKPMCDDPGCWVCKRMAELHAASTQYGWTKSPASTPERPRRIFDAGFAATPAPVEQEQLREVDERVNAEVARMDASQKVDAATMQIEINPAASPSLAAREAAEEIHAVVLTCRAMHYVPSVDRIESVIKRFCSPVEERKSD